MISEKIEMQKSFIADLDKSGKKRIQESKIKLDGLFNDESILMGDNKKYENLIKTKYQPQLEKVSSARSSLKRMNTIKIKLEQRIQNVTSDHKFFTDNVSCPTCGQKIEEEFRLNKIEDIEGKVKEINSAYKDLTKSINEEQKKDKEFLDTSKKITTLTNDCLLYTSDAADE